MRRIVRDFAAGKASVRIAINLDGAVGDPRKRTAIVSNKRYNGRMIWNRRQWRKKPDSDLRERPYRPYDRSEWGEVEARIVDEKLWDAARAEPAWRARPGASGDMAGQRRRRHLK